MDLKFNKKEYDAERQRILYAEYQERRLALEEKFGNVCYLCKQSKRKNFHLHHRYYHPIESNYPRHSKSMNVRWKRLKEAEEHPERFALLCPTCHRMLETFKHGDIDTDRFNELLGD